MQCSGGGAAPPASSPTGKRSTIPGLLTSKSRSCSGLVQAKQPQSAAEDLDIGRSLAHFARSCSKAPQWAMLASIAGPGRTKGGLRLDPPYRVYLFPWDWRVIGRPESQARTCCFSPCSPAVHDLGSWRVASAASGRASKEGCEYPLQGLDAASRKATDSGVSPSLYPNQVGVTQAPMGGHSWLSNAGNFCDSVEASTQVCN